MESTAARCANSLQQAADATDCGSSWAKLQSVCLTEANSARYQANTRQVDRKFTSGSNRYGSPTSMGGKAAMTTTRQRRSPLCLFPNKPTPRLYDGIVEVLRVRDYSRRTGEAYIHWIRRYIEFHQYYRPRGLAEQDVDGFLTHLIVQDHVAASTQNQALSAILFLYEHVLEQPLDRIEGVVQARRAKRLPLVLTVDEVSRVMSHLTGDKWLIAMLLYGGGLRLLESLRLRVNDLDFERLEITVREGKRDERPRHDDGLSGRPPPAGTSRARAGHSQAGPDRRLRPCRITPPLARKYPNANQEWGWQFVFPHENRWVNGRTGEQGQHHVHESLVQKAVKQAVRQAGLTKRATSHTDPADAVIRSPAAGLARRPDER